MCQQHQRTCESQGQRVELQVLQYFLTLQIEAKPINFIFIYFFIIESDESVGSSKVKLEKATKSLVPINKSAQSNRRMSRRIEKNKRKKGFCFFFLLWHKFICMKNWFLQYCCIFSCEWKTKDWRQERTSRRVWSRTRSDWTGRVWKANWA